MFYKKLFRVNSPSLQDSKFIGSLDFTCGISEYWLNETVEFLVKKVFVFFYLKSSWVGILMELPFLQFNPLGNYKYNFVQLDNTNCISQVSSAKCICIKCQWNRSVEFNISLVSANSNITH